MFNATLVKRHEITPDLLVLGVRPDAGVPDFLPGQYVALGLPGSAARPPTFPPEREPQEGDKVIKRAYSIGSAPSEKEALEFYVAVVPDGGLTSRLVLLKEGDRLFAAPKITGTFTIEPVPADHNLVLVATGTGLAPFISMVRSESTWTSGPDGTPRKITIVHGVRNSADLAYDDELRTLAAHRPNFIYHPIVSRDDSKWNGRRGRIQVLFEDKTIPLVSTVDHVFLCGNPAMIDSMEQWLAPLGYTTHSKKNPAGTLHVEKYW
jgi:ferredoxin--NADP+ reductase